MRHPEDRAFFLPGSDESGRPPADERRCDMDLLNSENVKMLVKALTCIDSQEDCKAFLEDLLTAQELVEIAQRFKVAEMLVQKRTYEEIARSTGASTATISRVNRCIRFGDGGYQRVLDRISAHDAKQQSQKS